MMTVEQLEEWLAEIYSDYCREEDQAILQGDLAKATRALAGKEALQRIRNRIGLRKEMHDNLVRMPRGRR